MSDPRAAANAETSPTNPFVELSDPAWRDEAFEGHANDAARRNQRLSNTWSTLSPIDIQDVVAALDCAAASANDPNKLEAALAVAAILTTGRLFADVIAFSLSSNAPCSSEKPGEGLVSVGAGWAWCLAPHVHDADRNLLSNGGADPQVFVKCEQHLLLECPTVVNRLIEAHLRSVHVVSPEQERSGALFKATAGADPRQIVELKAAVSKWLNSMRGDQPRRKLSPENARGWLASEIIRIPGADLGAARAITGAKPVTEISGTYGVYEVEYLRGLYREAVRPFNEELTEKIELPGGFIGRLKTPHTDTMQRLGAELQRPLKTTGRPSVIERHNAMVRYTFALLMVATGARPNANLTARIDPDAGFSILYDKSVQEPRARALWIPSEVIEQLNNYRNHLTALIPRLSPTARQELRQFSQANGEDSLPIFYLDESGRLAKKAASEVWRDSIKAIEPKLYDNSHRHFLHTQLVGRCAPESIQAIFGHWNVGTEPWSKTSGFDPLLYRADVEPKISSLLGEISWAPCHGLKAKKAPKRKQEVPGILSLIGENRPDPGSGWGSPGHRTNSPFNSCVHQSLPSFPAQMPRAIRSAAVPQRDREGRIGLILASAIENGLLLDPRWWSAWLTALSTPKRSAGILWLEMEPPALDDPQHVYCYPRRWFADELTRVLIDKWEAQFSVQDVGEMMPSPESCLATFLDPKRQRHQKGIISEFLASAEFKSRLMVPGLIVDYAIGNGPSVSVDEWAWTRLIAGRSATDRPKRTRAQRPERPRFDVPEEILAHIAAWSQLAKKLRKVGTRKWGQPGGYHGSTIKTYSKALEKVFGFQQVYGFSWFLSDTLDSIYSEYLLALSPGGTRNTTIKAIHLFQDYLVETGITEVTGENYWDLMVEDRVSNNLVSSREFERAQGMLDCGDRTSRMHRLIMMLGFRTGMRAREILALEFADLSESMPGDDTSFFEIRLQRSLKRDHSRRVIPLDVLLSVPEQDELRDWVARERGRTAWQKGNLLFANEGGGRGALPEAATTNSIGSLLKTASGDKSLHFRHLRHSFVSYLVTCLLLPRDGTQMHRPDAVDETCISEQRRDLILGRTVGKERVGTSVIHVVSQLVGHRPTSTTLRWYNHLLDWSTGAFVTRKLLDPLLPSKVAADLAKIELQSAVGADYRTRKSSKMNASLPDFSARYRLPALIADNEFRDGFVRLSAVRRSIDRSNRTGELQLRPQISLRQRRFFRYRSDVPEPANDREIAWPLVRHAFLRLRNNEDPVAIAAEIGVDEQTVSRWRETADQLVLPRRQGEVRPPFLYKMNASRRERFDLGSWTAQFPQPPRGAGIDIADQIWDYAVPRLGSPRGKEALHYFCQHYSTDTGLTTFSKKWEAEHFYRGFAELGFRGAMRVGVHVSSSKRAADVSQTQSATRSSRFQHSPEAEASLEVTLPRHLRAPKRKSPEQTGLDRDWPSYTAIRLEHPLHVNPECDDECHCRGSILFGILMLSIYALDRVREPPRRYPWKPGYGGYTPKEHYPGSRG